MKKDIHPPYQEVLFVDSATGKKFVCGWAHLPKERETFEGKEYPVFKLSISSASHPFFTGESKLVDSEGRVGKFQKKYLKKKQEEEVKVAAQAEVAAQAKKKATRKKSI